MTFTPASTAAFVVVLLSAATAAVARSARPPSSPARSADHRSVLVACVVFVVVLMASRWVTFALAAAALCHSWQSLTGDRSRSARARVDGVAKWLEDLRDTLRSSTVGAEEALQQVARRPPDAIAEPLALFARRRRQGFTTGEALDELRHALDHPTADAAVASLRMVVAGTAGAARLQHTVSQLAASARDEVRALERIDRTRTIYRSSMKRLIAVCACLVAYLRLMAGDLLAPYDTPTGQFALVVPLSMWTGCVLWLKFLCDGGEA